MKYFLASFNNNLKSLDEA